MDSSITVNHDHLLFQWIRDILSGDKTDLVNTIVSVLPNCDKP